METLRVYWYTGLYAIDCAGGDRLHRDIARYLKTGPVTLDFAAVGVVTAPFLQYAIGQLYNQFSHETIMSELTFDGLTAQHRTLLDVVLLNSRRYTEDPNYRAAVDAVAIETLRRFEEG